MNKIRKLPRPILYGAISAIYAFLSWPVWMLAQAATGRFIIAFLWIGSFAPVFLLYPELFEDGPTLFVTIINSIFWFFVGWLIGRYSKKVYVAILVWLGVQLLASFINIIRFIFFVGPT